MSQNDDGGAAFAIGIMIAAVIAGVVIIVVAIVKGIIAYCYPWSPFLFVVPFIALLAAAYGMAYLLDHRPGPRFGMAASAAVAGSAIFLAALDHFVGDAPALLNPGALLSVLAYFVAYAIAPAVIVCVVAALLSFELRSALMGETLVEIDRLPAELIEPIRPYLDGLLHHPPWRRFSLEWLWGEREAFRVSHDELKALFEKSRELVAENERGCRQEIALVQVQGAQEAAYARTMFLESLSPDDRGLLEVQLRAHAEVQAKVAELTRKNAELSRRLAKMGGEKQDLESKLHGWVLYLRDRTRRGQEAFALETLLTVGDREIRTIEQRRSERKKGARNAS